MGLPSSLCQAGSSFSLKAGTEREGCSPSPCHVRRRLCNTGLLCGSSDELRAQVPAVVISRAGDPGPGTPSAALLWVSSVRALHSDSWMCKPRVPSKVAQNAPQPRIRRVSALMLTLCGPVLLSG